MRTLIVVITAIVLSLQVALTASAVGPTFPINGQVIATSQEDNHRFINAKNTYPTGGTFENANVLTTQHLSKTGASAIKFEDWQGNERGAVGFVNGEEVGSGFFMAGYNYLAAGCFTPSAQACPAGTSNGFMLIQQGYFDGTYYDAPRVMCHKTTWVCTINKPNGLPIMTINPDGAVQFHGPVTFASGATIN